jgi:molybdenum cofactor synthesis domain-containing protein
MDTRLLMLTPSQAWACITANLAPLAELRIELAQALGFVLAEPIIADRDLPPANRSTMDGFAVRAVDLRTPPTTLRVVGEVAAGSSDRPCIEAGTCCRIYTGANVPPDADTVVKVEDTRNLAPFQVVLDVVECRGANIASQAEVAQRGTELVAQGQVLRPMHVAAAATAGFSTLLVFRKPSITLISTGRELQAPGQPVGPHQERDSNGPMLSSMLHDAGMVEIAHQSVGDDREKIVEALELALARTDVVVLTGGVSVGAFDFVPDAVTKVRARTLVHGVAMKPGKPFLFAVAPGGRLVFGLPGNPLSAATGLHEFVLPALRRLAGWGEDLCRPTWRLRLSMDVMNRTGRTRFALASLDWTSTGPEVTPLPSQNSADLAAGVGAHGVIVVPADVDRLIAGQAVDFHPWSRWP